MEANCWQPWLDQERCEVPLQDVIPANRMPNGIGKHKVLFVPRFFRGIALCKLTVAVLMKRFDRPGGQRVFAATSRCFGRLKDIPPARHVLQRPSHLKEAS